MRSGVMSITTRSSIVRSFKYLFHRTALLSPTSAGRSNIAKKLNRPVEVSDNNTVLWNQYLNNLSPEDLVLIDMTPDLIQFLKKEMIFCNAAVHTSDRLLVAATIAYHLLDSVSDKKDTWTMLYSIEQYYYR